MTVPSVDDPRERGARAVLFDDEGRLVLLRRTRPGQDPYLVVPGGGVQRGETDEQAAARECREELGAEILVGPVCWVQWTHGAAQRFHVARLLSIDPDARTGHEFSEPWRGGYETLRVDPHEPGALELLRPADLAAVLHEHADALAAEAAARPSAPPPAGCAGANVDSVG